MYQLPGLANKELRILLSRERGGILNTIIIILDLQKIFGLNVNLLLDHVPVKSIEGAVMIIMLELASFWSFINLCIELVQ